MSNLISRERWVLAGGCVTAVAGPGWAATYNWAGLSPTSNDWTAMGNWGVSASYPGSSDDAILNDPAPRDTPCVNSSDRTVRNLFVGDDMNVQLDNNLTASGSSGNGKVEFDGNVGIQRTAQGIRTLTGDWMVVLSRDRETVVTTQSTANIVIGA